MPTRKFVLNTITLKHSGHSFGLNQHMKFGILNSYSLLKINGSDSASFLQGQLTNDVNLLSGKWQYSGYCNPKGRLLALFILWKTDSNQFHALISKDLTESVVKRLRMFVMRSKVEIEVVDTTISGFETLQDLVAEQPDLNAKIDQNTRSSVCLVNQNQSVLKIANRYLLLSDQLSSSESFDSQWQTQNIVDGLPQISELTTELFIPQMINLDLLDGINFKKGCYTGQEIVARMHYLGKVKQRMFVCEVNGQYEHINAGEKIYNNLDERKTVGNIVSAVKQNNKLLAVLKLEHIEKDLYLDGGQKINIMAAQPYSIPI